MGTVLCLKGSGAEPRIRRLSGELVGKSLVEEVLSPPKGLGRKQDIYATIAALRDPVLGDWACLTCALHDADGTAYGAAVGWNAGVVELEETFAGLVTWAEKRAQLAGRFVVWEDAAELKMYPLGIEPETVITLPYSVVHVGVEQDESTKRKNKCGAVLPFPARGTSQLR